MNSQSDTLGDFLIIENPVHKKVKNALFLEGGGNGILYSLNYDRRKMIKPNFGISARLGYGLTFIGGGIDHAFIGEGNIFYGGVRHFGEFGIGLTHARTNSKAWIDPNGNLHDYESLMLFRLGYRYQPEVDEGFFIRAAVTPVFYKKIGSGPDEFLFMFWAGFCFGFAF